MHSAGTCVSLPMQSDLADCPTSQWRLEDLNCLEATEDTFFRLTPDGALVSTMRPKWGYMAVLRLSADDPIEEIEVSLKVLAGAVATVLTTRGDQQALYQQVIPTGADVRVYMPYSLVSGETQLVLRSASPRNEPAVALIRSIRFLGHA